MVHGFDTFEGLPEERGAAERALIAGGDYYLPGHYRGRYEELLSYCEGKYSNFKLHKGIFKHSITDEFLVSMLEYKPILIWVDCDYYASTVFEKMIPWIPTGWVIYFDDIYYNFSSRFTGEMRAVWELNHGTLGDGVELVFDRDLSLDSDRIYRFINLNGKVQHRLRERSREDPVRHRGDDSPFP